MHGLEQLGLNTGAWVREQELARHVAGQLSKPPSASSSAACALLQGQPVAVFKPSDEEPFSANNPKLHRAPTGSTAEGLRRGVQPGEGAVREVGWRPSPYLSRVLFFTCFCSKSTYRSSEAWSPDFPACAQRASLAFP